MKGHVGALLVGILGASTGCAVKKMPNDQRAIVKAEWVPEGALAGDASYAGPEVAGLKTTSGAVYSDGSRSDPEFYCIEPVTPAMRLRALGAEAGVPSADVTVSVDYSESMGTIYNISDVVLLAQTQAFQACLARLSGDFNAEEYTDELAEIRANATELVQAQVAGNLSVTLHQVEELLYAHQECLDDGGDAARCDPWKETADELLKLLPELAAAAAPAGGGGDGSSGDPPGGGDKGDKGDKGGQDG